MVRRPPSCLRDFGGTFFSATMKFFTPGCANRKRVIFTRVVYALAVDALPFARVEEKQAGLNERLPGLLLWSPPCQPRSGRFCQGSTAVCTPWVHYGTGTLEENTKITASPRLSRSSIRSNPALNFNV